MFGEVVGRFENIILSKDLETEVPNSSSMEYAGILFLEYGRELR